MFTSDTGAQNYYVTDGAVGSPIALINTSGTQTAAYSYDPYGTYMTTSSTGSAAGFNPARFAGGIYDRTTGDLHYGQRWYDDSIGRFTQQDSVSHLEDLKQENRYAYAGDDPINNIDPTGKSFLSALGDVVDDVVTDAVTVATDGLACITAASSALEVAAPLITPTFSTGLGGIAVSGAVAVVGCTTGIIAGEDLIKPEGS